MKIRAIACDIDQTLTDENLLLDLYAVQTIRFLTAAGFPVILDTARDHLSAGWLAVFMGTCGLVAAENGGVIWDAPRLAAPQVVGKRERVNQALAALQSALGERISVYPSPTRLSAAVVRGSFSVEEGNAILRARDIPARLLDSGLAYHLIDADTHKGTGLCTAAAQLGIRPEEVAAIGDNYNDLEMFAAAGTSVAVGNAPDPVKNQVDIACQARYGEGFVEGVRYLWDRLDLPAGLQRP